MITIVFQLFQIKLAVTKENAGLKFSLKVSVPLLFCWGRCLRCQQNPLTQWGTKGCCIYHSSVFLCFSYYYLPHFPLFKLISPCDFSYRNISGKNGTTELMVTTPVISVFFHVFIFYRFLPPHCCLGAWACTSNCNHRNFLIRVLNYTINVF